MSSEMSQQRWWLLPVGVLGLGLLLTVPFWTGDLDLRVAHWVQTWNDARGGNQEDQWWWRLPYLLPPLVTVAAVIGGLIAVISGIRRQASSSLRAGLYLLLVLGLGCGVLVNVILKDHWGRPRPRDTIELGGNRSYLPPWCLGIAGYGKSFPSGHVAVPALGIALWLLWRRHRPLLARWSLAGGLALTIWVGAGRILAQGHWLSDVLWSLVLMTVVAAVLHRAVMRDQPCGSASP